MKNVYKSFQGWACGFLLVCLISPGVEAQQLASARVLSRSGTGALTGPAGQSSARMALTDVLRQLEAEYKVSFIYAPEVVSDKVISLPLRSKKLPHRLKEALDKVNLSFRKLDEAHYVIIDKAPAASRPHPQSSLPEAPEAATSPAQTSTAVQPASQEATALTITGRVTDQESGEGLPGVNVLLKGTSTGTTTGSDGRYSLSIPDGSGGNTLVFSFIGYVTQELPIGNRTTINTALAPDMQALSEVVFVGYGTQQRREVTGAIATVDLKEIQDMPVSNVATALQGRVPGVVIQQVTGRPGATPAIRVRGFGSISAGNNPLIVLDGNIVDRDIFNILDASEIDRIDVLKDASATAIYGSRGSNGVVLITSKTGTPGKTSINLNYYTGFQQLERKMDMLNSQQFAEFSKDAFNNGYLDNVSGATINDPNSMRRLPSDRFRYPRGEEFSWLNFDDPQAVASLPYTDFQDLIFQRAPISSYQANINGGTDKVRYFLSGGYLTQDGVVKQSSFDRYSVRAYVNAELLPKLRVGLILNPSFRRTAEPSTDGHWAENGVINAALSAVPMAPVYGADGITYSSQTELAGAYGWPGITNPLANITEYGNTIQNMTLLSNAFAEYEIIKGLLYRVTGNVNLGSLRRDEFRTSRMPLNQLLPPTQAFGGTSSGLNVNWLFNQTLNYRKTLANVHNLDLLVGMEATRSKSQFSGVRAINFGSDVVRTLNAGTVNNSNANFADGEFAVASYFSRIGYNYKSKYLVNFSVRTDGSSQFGPENRWGTFPAGSVGWQASEEPFLKNLAFLSNLKLRASYGFSGNNAFGNYPYVSRLQNDNYVFNNALASGLAPALALGNPRLGWEKSRQMDAGIDVGFFNDRFTLMVDYYDRLTTDLLFTVPVPTLTGFSNVVQNLGKVENKGWEFALNTVNLTGAFEWKTSANISFNRNKVLALGPNGDPIRSGSGIGETNITLIGQPLGSFFGYRQLGVYRDQADLDASPKTNNSRPGDVKYADLSGPNGVPDGIIDANDRTVIGNNQPDFIYGMTNSFSFKGIDLGISIQGIQGGEILNLSRRFYENLEGNSNNLTTVLDRWRSPAQPGDGTTPRANSRTTGLNNALSTRWVEDASYLRIQNLTLGYSLPAALVQRTLLQKVRVYASVQNLRTFTNYLGYNPETSNYETTALTAGVDYGAYPVPRAVTFGVNLGF